MVLFFFFYIISLCRYDNLCYIHTVEMARIEIGRAYPPEVVICSNREMYGWKYERRMKNGYLCLSVVITLNKYLPLVTHLEKHFYPGNQRHACYFPIAKNNNFQQETEQKKHIPSSENPGKGA